MAEKERARSLSREGDDASSSPLDGVKLELAIVVLIAGACALVVAAVELATWLELVIMAAIGFGSGGWIAYRTRRVMNQQLGGGSETAAGQEERGR